MGSSTVMHQEWFEVEELESGVWSIFEPFHAEQVRSYLMVGQREAALIDTGMGIGDIRAVVATLTSRPVRVINSHAHWDHIGGNARFDRIAIHAAEAGRLDEGVPAERLRRAFALDQLRGPLPEGYLPGSFTIAPSPPTELLQGGESIDLGGVILEVIHAPGHSPGGIVLLDRERGFLISTDVAYAGLLYCYGEDADPAVYLQTMSFLADLAPSLRSLYPSHDASPASPSLLPKMRDGLRAIVGGRSPDRTISDSVVHDIGGFRVRMPLPDATLRPA